MTRIIGADLDLVGFELGRCAGAGGLRDAGRHLDRPSQRCRLVLGLLELAFRDRPGDDPGAGVDVGLAVLEDRAPDGDRGVEVAVVAEVADGAAIQPATLALRGRDELHRADLRRPRQRPRREDRAKRVERVELRLEPPLDVRDEMEDVAVALDLHVLADGHGPRPRDPAEVVAAEVDEHHVLGSLLGVALELLGEQGVLAIVRAARTGPGDRVGGELVALDLEQQLRRCADHLEAGGADEEQVRARVDPPERAIEPDPVERRPGRGVVREVERLAPREHDLDRLAGGDGVLGDLDGMDVLVAPEAGSDGAAERPCLGAAPPARPAGRHATRWRRTRRSPMRTGCRTRRSRLRSGARFVRGLRRSPPRRSGNRALGLTYEPWMRNLRDKTLRNGALIAMDYQTGEILAYQGSADPTATRGNKKFQPQFDVLSDGWRQPGSAFKPIVYAAGIDGKKITAASMFMDVVTDFGGG